jgi:hypothetical protein
MKNFLTAAERNKQNIVQESECCDSPKQTIKFAHANDVTIIGLGVGRLL